MGAVEPDVHNEPHWAAQLYDACAAEVVVYGRALGLSHAEAEDVLHDAFRALLDLETAPREPKFYLVRTFRNHALNHRRGLWRRIAREFESVRWFERDPGESPIERSAMAALRHLPGDQREVIVLKLWHDLTFDAIGELLDISPNTAAGRYRYGLQRMRASLKTVHQDHELAEEPGNDPRWISATTAVRQG